LSGLRRYNCSVSILDREDSGSNPPQGKTELNGSLSVNMSVMERNIRVERASSHSSSSADDKNGDFRRQLLGAIQSIVLMCVRLVDQSTVSLYNALLLLEIKELMGPEK
jgi:hypothetical protein